MNPKLLSRIAVSSLFFVAGFIHANWVSRIPEIQEFWQVSNSTLGTILLVSAGGAVLAMPFSGVFIVRFGSRKMSIITIFILCVIVAFIPLMQSLWVIFTCFFLLGVLGGSMDVSINGQAIYVERDYNKPIMSSFHAFFSVGTVIGAGVSALFAKFQVPLLTHFMTSVIFSLILILVTIRYLVRDEKSEGTATEKEGEGGFRLPTAAILPLGVIAFCGMSGEGAMSDWSALYMNKIVGMDASFSALAFGFFVLAMTIGRVFGDYFIAKFGTRKTLIINSLLAIFGLALLLSFINPYIVFLGFFISGLGVATIVPIVYSKAGNTEGVPPSVGIAMATTVGYAGFFVAPPIIGYLADVYNLRIALFFTLALYGVMILLVNHFIKK